MLLEQNYGLTSLLSKLAAILKKDENYVTSVHNIMEILMELMDKFGESMNNYLVAIKVTNMVLFTFWKMYLYFLDKF